MRLGIVTATTSMARSATTISGWMDHAGTHPRLEIIFNGMGTPYLGTVPAFRQGVDALLKVEPALDVIACLHDDVDIAEHEWDWKVLRHFEREPKCGLLGFGGAIGLGSSDLYQTPYNPMQLARIGFRSNMPNAEVHGIRSLLPERVACLDGFSQIGRREFWEGVLRVSDRAHGYGPRPWTFLEDHGVVHHFYDGMLGCLARRYGWDVWYLPIACQHFGGRTAVGDAGYQDWAKTQHRDGDHGFWEQAHLIGYEQFRDVLPIRL